MHAVHLQPNSGAGTLCLLPHSVCQAQALITTGHAVGEATGYEELSTFLRPIYHT